MRTRLEAECGSAALPTRSPLPLAPEEDNERQEEAARPHHRAAKNGDCRDLPEVAAAVQHDPRAARGAAENGEAEQDLDHPARLTNGDQRAALDRIQGRSIMDNDAIRQHGSEIPLGGRESEGLSQIRLVAAAGPQE